MVSAPSDELGQDALRKTYLAPYAMEIPRRPYFRYLETGIYLCDISIMKRVRNTEANRLAAIGPPPERGRLRSGLWNEKRPGAAGALFFGADYSRRAIPIDGGIHDDRAAPDPGRGRVRLHGRRDATGGALRETNACRRALPHRPGASVADRTASSAADRRHRHCAHLADDPVPVPMRWRPEATRRPPRLPELPCDALSQSALFDH